MLSDILSDAHLKAILDVMAGVGIEGAADGLSQMIGQKITVSMPSVTVLPLTAVPEHLGGAERPVVGIYLGCGGDMGGHVMLILSQVEAAYLVDLLMGYPEGTTHDLDSLARSALAEAGNMTASFFLNAVARVLGVSSRPTPPAVIIDMAGAILDIMLVTVGELGDEVLLLEAVFRDRERQLKLFFWMVPDLEPLRRVIVTRN